MASRTLSAVQPIAAPQKARLAGSARAPRWTRASMDDSTKAGVRAGDTWRRTVLTSQGHPVSTAIAATYLTTMRDMSHETVIAAVRAEGLEAAMDDGRGEGKTNGALGAVGSCALSVKAACRVRVV